MNENENQQKDQLKHKVNLLISELQTKLPINENLLKVSDSMKKFIDYNKILENKSECKVDLLICKLQTKLSKYWILYRIL